MLAQHPPSTACRRHISLFQRYTQFIASNRRPSHADIACYAQITAAVAVAQALTPLGSLTANDEGARKSRYLTFAEYVALQQQFKEQQAASNQQQQAGEGTAGHQLTAAGAVHSPQSTSDAEQQPQKRVPWNKGRKHSALTIARIKSGNARARERPEVQANVAAANQSRIGVPLPEEWRESIRRGGLEARMRRLQNTTPEEREARHRELSERSKQLWQDPEYVQKTTAAIRVSVAKRERTRKASKSVEDQQQEAAADSSSSEQQAQQLLQHSEQQQQQQQDQERPKQQRAKKGQPTKKELAAAAAEQRQQLQQQVNRLLQMQQLISTSERSVLDLQRNLQAFENDPQAYQIAANTMQQAQVHLGTLKSQVDKLQQGLQQRGVQWDHSSGQITHVPGLPEPKSSKSKKDNSRSSKDGAKKATRGSSSAAAAAGSNADGVVRSSRVSQAASAAAAAGPAAADDVVRSARRQAGGAQNGRALGNAAVAAAASRGGSRISAGGSGTSWEVPAAGQHANGLNGTAETSQVGLDGMNRKHQLNGYGGNGSSGEGSSYVTVQVERDVAA